MLFNSFHFAVFFPIVTAGYFLLPHRFRWAWLLAASCYFYSVFIPVYLLALFALIVNDYVSARGIERSQGATRRAWLFASLAGNIGLLAFFKYWFFLDANLAALGNLLGWNYSPTTLAFVLPIGLSFHTFQSIAYTVEVYRGTVPAERHLGILALYVMFYPQLVAGPIERPQNMLHQLRERHGFDYARVADGLRLMAWGFFKKMVVADRLAVHVNRVYGDPTAYDGLGLSVATVFFAFQIYCDFSGYTDIARGAARVMGFRLTLNFAQPYFATSVSDFWRRWHISLSTWFRDYVYIPLGGNRTGPARWQVNLMVTFLASGLWHGASWTFVAWGCIHGVFLVAAHWKSVVLQAVSARLRWVGRWSVPRAVKMAVVFGAVSFAWIFFRAEDLDSALYISTHLFSGVDQLFGDRNAILGALRSNLPVRNELIIIAGALSSLFAVEYLQERGMTRPVLLERPVWFRWTLYYGVLIAVLCFGVFEQSQFIYFQF